MHRSIKAIGLLALIFLAAHAAQLYFVPDIVAGIFAENPQSPWKVNLAFVLTTIQYISAISAALFATLAILRNLGLIRRA